jgi:XTP/dITP diphosphohydrolase
VAERKALLVASGNPKKRRELAELLARAPVEIVGIEAFPNFPEIEETGATFEANADLKALAASRHAGILALADDSGLEVDALAGAPGVRSARYASEGPGNATDEANRAKLLRELEGIPNDRRTARFRCAISVALGGKVVLQTSGVVEGRILGAERGAGGFGYDPLFVPAGHARTFAEMDSQEKAALSHRGRALADLRPRLLALLG